MGYNQICVFVRPKGGSEMKKRSAIIAASLAVSLLCGCASVNVNIKTAGDETGDAAPDVVSSAPQLDSADFDYTKKDDKGNIYFESHGNTWSLDDASVDRYPKLSKTLSEIEDYVRKDIEDCIAENENDAKQFAADNAGTEDAYYTYDADMGPACADEKVTSLVETQFTFLGGAHPDTITLGYNIDSATGEFIPLSAVISDKDGLDAILKEKLIELYTDHAFFGLDESFGDLAMTAAGPSEDNDPYSQYIWSFSPNGLTFYFNPSVLSPYADGGEQIDLTYDELSSVLEDHFKNLYSEQ